MSAPNLRVLSLPDTYLSEKVCICTTPCSANAFTLFVLSLFFCAEVLMKETVGGFYSCLSSQSVLHTRHSRMCSREAALFCKHGFSPQYHQIHVVHACKRCLHGLSCLHGSQDIAEPPLLSALLWQRSTFQAIAVCCVRVSV